MVMRRFRLPSRLPLRLLGLLLGVLLLDYLWYPAWSGPAPSPPPQTENGIWLRYTWYFGRHSDADVHNLAQRLRRHRIRYAYFHVRHIQGDGTLRYRFPEHARRLIWRLRAEAPSVRVLAWIYAGNNGAGGLPVARLADPTVRHAMVREAGWLVESCGFDGVQWDYEICPDADPGLLALLEETREAVPQALVSLATPLWAPGAFRRWTWSEAGFERAAERCDQMVVMGYDSGLYLPRAYAWLMHNQVTHVTPAVQRANRRSGRKCRVLIGVPTYARGGPSHHANAENLRIAVRGVREGLADSRAAPGVFSGIAPFADYTTQENEWADFRELWLDGADRPGLLDVFDEG